MNSVNVIRTINKGTPGIGDYVGGGDVILVHPIEFKRTSNNYDWFKLYDIEV
jgi:hypothetical protein